MCISFFDLELPRQEEITVEAHRLTAENPNDRFWGWRADGFDTYLRDEAYPAMKRGDLNEHIAGIRSAHPDDVYWAALADLAESTLHTAAAAAA